LLLILFGFFTDTEVFEGILLELREEGLDCEECYEERFASFLLDLTYLDV